jgi:peptidoglycan/xylan/chitin deacetylase (PgdA/CDA1 family)
MTHSKMNVRGKGSSRSVRVLHYLNIVDEQHSQREFEITKECFQKQMAWLRRWGYSPITFLDYIHYLNGDLDLPRRPVIITFDGVSKTVFEVARPILKQLGMSAVYFVLADPSIRELDSTEEGGRLTELLTSHQILELHVEGNEIGSLTNTCRRLTTLSDEAAWEEISRSRVLLEILLNAPVKTIAYPHGLVSDKTKKMAADAGYCIACSADSGPPLIDEDLFEVRRVRIENTRRAFAFWIQLQDMYLHYRWLRWIVRSTFLAL